MVVPFIPIVSNTSTRIVNKTIVYSDTVLPLKGNGENLEVTVIENISELQLESCLKTIFESNPDTLFHTIQYSKNNKKVYFYTDKKLLTEAWKEKSIRKYKPLSDTDTFMRKINELLEDKDDENNNCNGISISQDNHVISLYDVLQFMSEYESSYNRVLKGYKSVLESKIKMNFKDALFCVHRFIHDKNEFHVSFKRYSFSEWEDIVFAQSKEGDLFISQSNSIYDREVFQVIGNDLSNLFRDMHQFDLFREESSYGIPLVNSDLCTDISSYGVKVYSSFINFKLQHYTYEKDYKYDCNSLLVLNAIKGKEDELFKRLYVRIFDCPKWCQELLIERRKKQILEFQKQEEIRKERIALEQIRLEEAKREAEEKEKRKQNRKKLVKKLFPFIN